MITGVGLDVPLMRNSEYYIVDGNKNVIELRNAEGAVTASYAYNPFGAQESPTAEDENPFRFSSEFHDDETGLVYYNYRYYSPSLGRWIKRDPIEEKGGRNLYVMCKNNILSSYDALGKYTLEQAQTSLVKRGVPMEGHRMTWRLQPHSLMPNKFVNTPVEVGFYTDQQIYNEWYSLEKTNGTWWTVLPKCPQKICRKGKKYTIVDEVGLDRSKWKEPTAANFVTHNYHTKAARIELRSVPICGHSNQCIYVESSNTNVFIMSREIPIAGTADFKAPGGAIGEVWHNWTKSGDGHQTHDVLTFDLARSLDGMPGENINKYYEVRPIW